LSAVEYLRQENALTPTGALDTEKRSKQLLFNLGTNVTSL